ncbi:M20/M25/M40 family metallo-hydrolase [Sediminivirga luteola]|nr:M20/M25/M40 family metallo-hydrolase [Sediminivirga luteola]MCI2264781.1 M20/M25/M40 family metallo-hydrolase [Sediminivirga luteola]
MNRSSIQLPPGLLPAAEARLEQMIADIRTLVEVETPSSDLEAVAAGAAEVARLMRERLGAGPETIVIDGVTHLRLRFGDGPARVVLVNHQDTVWPHGTLNRLPFTAEDGVLRGPGVFDMLTGLVMSVHAAALVAQSGRPLEGLSILVTGDEEVGSITSRDLILTEAAEARAVYVMEAAADGALKVARKGVAMYQVTVHGRSSHAGLDPEKGINAGVGLGLLLPQIAALSDPQAGTTVTPTVLSGGTTTNTVPAEARVQVDSRAASRAEQERVDAAIRALPEPIPGATVTVTGGINRPVMPRAAAEELLAEARRVAAELGLAEPEAVEVGGASDGNFTGGAGIPTLDGLGAAGAGAHADHEHAIIAEIAPRTALLAGLISARL